MQLQGTIIHTVKVNQNDSQTKHLVLYKASS